MNEIVSDNILKSFRAFVNGFIETDDKLFDTLISNFEFKKVSRKELLLEAGKTANKIFFLHEGFVRFFHTKSDGTEVTSDFYFAPGFITSFKVSRRAFRRLASSSARTQASYPSPVRRRIM